MTRTHTRGGLFPRVYIRDASSPSFPEQDAKESQKPTPTPSTLLATPHLEQRIRNQKKRYRGLTRVLEGGVHKAEVGCQALTDSLPAI